MDHRAKHPTGVWDFTSLAFHANFLRDFGFNFYMKDIP